MSLQGPNSDDIKKIHAEVNQIVNQRILITTLAVTVFAAMTAWIVPKTPITPGSSIEPVVYAASVMMTLVLFALFLLITLLTQMLRIFTSYLDVTSASSWEGDWRIYRKRFSYMGYTRPQAFIFLMLGLASAGFPFMLWATYSMVLEPTGVILCVTTGGLYCILVCGLGLARWGIREDELRRRWKKLQDE